jgi:subtilisin
MKRISASLISLILVVVLATSSFANSSTPHVKTYFVSFKVIVDPSVITKIGGQIKRQYTYMPVVAARLPIKAAQALTANPAIDYVEEDGEVQAIGQSIPWGISHVKSRDVQEMGFKGKGIKVGIIDTGIDYKHEDLQVHGGATFVDGTTDYLDDNGHGTHVAGTVAALNNDLGVLGTAPQAELYAIKVLDQNGGGSYSDVIAGIEWAITANMNIVNMSFGGNSGSRTLQKAVDNAYKAGILLVAAAGNNGFDRKGTITYPAKYDSVIAVGAVNQMNERANFSSVGRELELMAPGVGVASTVLGGYATYSGTSMAAPHVAGVAAQLWEAKPELNNTQIRNVLNSSAIYLGESFYYGNGLIDVLGAMTY